jgi:hypothetical protein
VSAILATGVVVMALYGLLATVPVGARARRWSRPGVLVVAALLVVVAAPLAVSSVRVARTTSEQNSVSRVVTEWATGNGWSLASLTHDADDYTARVLGPPPEPSTDQLQANLDAAGLGDVVVNIELVPERGWCSGPAANAAVAQRAPVMPVPRSHTCTSLGRRIKGCGFESCRARICFRC